MRHRQLLVILLFGLVIALPAKASPLADGANFTFFPINSSFSLAVPIFSLPHKIPLQNAQNNPTPTLKACHICGEEERKEAVVHAILFWMATCGHCHYVLTEVLPPLEEKYGEQLQILKIEVETMEDFDRLYQVAQLYNIPKEEVGVPFLVIGDRVLIGSRQIPDELPGLIKTYLSEGGLNFPDVLRSLLPEIAEAEKKESTAMQNATPTIPAAQIPGLLTSLATATPLKVQSPTPVPSPTADMEETTLGSRYTQKPQGYELALTLEIGMILALLWGIWNGIRVFLWKRDSLPKPSWLIALWIGVGFVAASYLAFVEVYEVKAVCGPIGDCNAVQQSAYARLFGIFPLGMLGVGAYLLMFLIWWIARKDLPLNGHWVMLLFYFMALFGVGFSIYLTYLELFVIHAICAWCLTSALMMTLILLSCTLNFSKAIPIKAIEKPNED